MRFINFGSIGGRRARLRGNVISLVILYVCRFPAFFRKFFHEKGNAPFPVELSPVSEREQSPFSTVVVFNRDAIPAFTTKDGSTIREILAPNNAPQVIRHQSLAEAIVTPGTATQAHYHPLTEEIYYILHGVGRMQIGDSLRMVAPGDAIAIPPGAHHRITNTGNIDLVFLCCCAPAYTHADTIMVELTEPDGVG